MQPSSFQITGSDEFTKLARTLDRVGSKSLNKELTKGLKKAARTLIPYTKAAARAELPKRGGLNRRVASSPQRIKVRTNLGRGNPGVFIIAGQAGSGAVGADIGFVRHPVFGDREVWATTLVRQGWFTETLKARKDVAVRPMLEAMDQIAKEIRHG